MVTPSRLADEAMFHGYKEDIRFAALTLDMQGLANYGDCYIVLRTEMVAHRATVFEENSTMFMRRHGVLMSEADKLPRGFRATWANRGRLCVAKLFSKIDANTTGSEYSKLLVRQGATTADDDFVEVHAIDADFSALTTRLFVRVGLHRKSPPVSTENRFRATLRRGHALWLSACLCCRRVCGGQFRSGVVRS